MADLTPEQIAEIATKAAMAAVAAATGGAQAPSTPPEQSGEFSADDLARFKQQQVHGPVAVYSRSSFSSKRRVAK